MVCLWYSLDRYLNKPLSSFPITVYNDGTEPIAVGTLGGGLFQQWIDFVWNDDESTDRMYFVYQFNMFFVLYRCLKKLNY